MNGKGLAYGEKDEAFKVEAQHEQRLGGKYARCFWRTDMAGAGASFRSLRLVYG